VSCSGGGSPLYVLLDGVAVMAPLSEEAIGQEPVGGSSFELWSWSQGELRLRMKGHRALSRLCMCPWNFFSDPTEVTMSAWCGLNDGLTPRLYYAFWTNFRLEILYSLDVDFQVLKISYGFQKSSKFFIIIKSCIYMITIAVHLWEFMYSVDVNFQVLREAMASEEASGLSSSWSLPYVRRVLQSYN
jgi:hypothetical protein